MKKLLVPIDFSDHTPAVLRAASELGAALEAKLWLVHIADPEPDFVGYEPGPDVVRDQVAEKLRGEHTRLHELADELRDRGLDVTALAIQGPTVQSILSEAEKLGVDLIVLGSHGHGAIYRSLVGSVSEGVLHRSTCPVLIVPPERGRPQQ